jgi:hypothetical protein
MKNDIKLNLFVLIIALSIFSCKESIKKELSLNPLFSDYRVLQQQDEVATTGIKEPKYVRNGWKDYVSGTLFNDTGLPTSTFTTEN